MFEIVGREKQEFNQWEQDVILTNPCMKAGDEVVFRNSSGATYVMIAGASGVEVPNKILQMSCNILVDLEQGLEQHTDCQTVFKVNPGAKPDGYVCDDNSLREKYGYALDVTLSREGCAADAKAVGDAVGALSGEIEALKESGGISGGTTNEETGVVVQLNCVEGAEIKVTGETTEAVTLVHHGRNFLPKHTGSAITVKGLTVTPNEDGTIHITGTATSDHWIDITTAAAPFYLPAGQYVLTINATDVGVNNGGVSLSLQCADGSGNYMVGSPYGRMSLDITLDEGKEVAAFYTVWSGTTIDETISGQIDIGQGLLAVTEYEPYRAEIVEGALPKTLIAYDGINYLYTKSGDVLTASSNKSIADIIDDAVARRTGIDWTAYGLPILYLNGDTIAMTKDNAVDLVYVYGDRIGTASVKWQGSSSLAYPKKNYTIKFDEAFEAKAGWGEQKKYCFKANWIDHSHARNVCSCKLWGEIVKSRDNVPSELFGLPNGGAIDGFPCIIMLNGEFHGLFTWNIPKDGWMFGSPKAILCADAHTDATKFKALATLNGDFELEYAEDETNTDWILTSINTAIQAVMDSNGSDLDSVVNQYVDISSAIDYFIHTVDENADDGTAKNYILVTFDGVKWYFSAYDRDTVYGLYWNGQHFTSPSSPYVTYAGYASSHRVMELIYNHKKADLKARAIALRDGIKSEANVATVFSNFIGAIPSQIFDEDVRKWPTIPNSSASNLAQILNWYRLRRILIDAEIDAMT